MRKTLVRFLALLVVVASTLAVWAGPAQAFRRSTSCNTLSRGVYFVADNGDSLATVVWDWSAANHIDVFIWDWQNDGAEAGVRVDSEDSGVIAYPDRATWTNEEPDYQLFYPIRKWRMTWNGYASDWFQPRGCPAGASSAAERVVVG